MYLRNNASSQAITRVPGSKAWEAFFFIIEVAVVLFIRVDVYVQMALCTTDADLSGSPENRLREQLRPLWGTTSSASSYVRKCFPSVEVSLEPQGCALGAVSVRTGRASWSSKLQGGG